ncbi:MAG: hypothetical protein WBH40_05845, partial [Ignavibacteriaceae bacterium]
MKNIITLIIVFFFCCSITALSQFSENVNYTKRFAEVNAIIPDFQVNDDLGSEGQGFSSISTDSGGNFVITWTDGRNDDDIYAQRYSSDGTALGSNFKVNDDLGSERQWFSSISTDGSGNFVITWGDWRNGDSDIYAQRYSSDGNPLGTNFKVNDDLGSHWQDKCFVSADESGSFVIAWSDDYRNGEQDIYAQRYSSDGTALGSNFKVNDASGSVGGWPGPPPPSISTDGSGNFVITWTDGRNDDDIYAQRYSSDGTALG